MSKLRWAVITTAALAVVVAAVTTALAASGRSGSAATTAPPTTSTTTIPPTTTTGPPTTTTTEPPTTTTPPTTAPPTTEPPTTAPPPSPTLHPRDEGDAVLQLQQRLVALGYWLGEPDATYGRLTVQAVMAFQKAHGLERDGIAGPATLAALDAPTPLTPLSTVDGVEIDLDRQLLLVVEGGAVRWALNTSTGRAGWRTPRGDFAVYRTIDGVRHAPLGDLYRPAYFIGGVAFHGSSSIPGYPASHGCARLSNAAMDMLWATGIAVEGTPVRVY